VPVISFTGSTKTGKAISAVAAENLKRLGLELGGKAPMIVFDDAELDVAVPEIMRALTVFAGQFCMTGSRLLVQSGVAEAVRTRLAERFRQLRVGTAADSTSEIGPHHRPEERRAYRRRRRARH
jgi:betaine-aldehyde dehydrogenase